MKGRRTAFRRMVVGLPQSIASNAAVAAAADLAEFLQIELYATFVADPTLLALAELPSVRELRTLGQGWQSIDLAQIMRDIDHAAIAARRGFTESVKSRAIKTSFAVVTDTEAIAALIHADDIVAIIEPRHPAETITRQFTGLVDAALNIGEIRAWDFQPLRDAARQYIRNSAALDDLERIARFPPVRPRI